jgi:hypothetical protein
MGSGGGWRGRLRKLMTEGASPASNRRCPMASSRWAGRKLKQRLVCYWIESNKPRDAMTIEISDRILEKSGLTPAKLRLELAIILFQRESLTLELRGCTKWKPSNNLSCYHPVKND